MFPTVLAMLLMAVSDGAKNEVQLLIDSIEAVQQPIQDFRCEFEGTLRFKGTLAEEMKADGDGLHETFSGIFIWKTGGDTHSESLHRRAPDGQITRESLVVRMRERQAERYSRLDDGPSGVALIEDPSEVNSSDYNCLGSIFLIDQNKRDTSDRDLEASLGDEQIEGRPLKVLSIRLKNAPDWILRRYWIDLRRSGHVVREQGYLNSGAVEFRLDIKLAPFRLGATEVWMPISGVAASYASIVDKKAVANKEPTSLGAIYVVDGTMEFNKRPGPEVFTMKYKPGTPISDNLRKLT